MIAFVFIFVLLINSKDFLISIDQDPDVSEQTASYMIWYFPGLMIYGISDLYRKYLNSFRMNMIPFLSSQFLSHSIHFGRTYLSFTTTIRSKEWPLQGLSQTQSVL